MKTLYISILLAGLLVGCGSSGSDSSNGSANGSSGGSSNGSANNGGTNNSTTGKSDKLKFDQAFMDARETTDDRYLVVTCEDTGLTYNGTDYGDVATYDYNEDLVSAQNTGNASYTLTDGKIIFNLSGGTTYSLTIDKDYGDYAVVKVGFNNFPTDYSYWYPKPVKNVVSTAFAGYSKNYMDHSGGKFYHQGRCSENSLNEHIADWESK